MQEPTPPAPPLSLQLPFALVPLPWLTTRRKDLGAFAFGRPLALLLWCGALLVALLNGWMLQRWWLA